MTCPRLTPAEREAVLADFIAEKAAVLELEPEFPTRPLAEAEARRQADELRRRLEAEPEDSLKPASPWQGNLLCPRT